MSLRSLFKVPRNALFYFEIDNSTSILATKHIQKVLSGDRKTEGSKVVVKYGEQDLEATILAVAGKQTCLTYKLNLI